MFFICGAQTPDHNCMHKPVHLPLSSAAWRRGKTHLKWRVWNTVKRNKPKQAKPSRGGCVKLHFCYSLGATTARCSVCFSTVLPRPERRKSFLSVHGCAYDLTHLQRMFIGDNKTYRYCNRLSPRCRKRKFEEHMNRNTSNVFWTCLFSLTHFAWVTRAICVGKLWVHCGRGRGGTQVSSGKEIRVLADLSRSVKQPHFEEKSMCSHSH